VHKHNLRKYFVSFEFYLQIMYVLCVVRLILSKLFFKMLTSNNLNVLLSIFLSLFKGKHKTIMLVNKNDYD